MTTLSIDPEGIVGASSGLINGCWSWPVHGLRHPPGGQTTGWYVWTGELDPAPGFFKPWHVRHLVAECPEVALHLTTPPGSRFLIAPGHTDVWFDESLLTP